MGGVSGHQVRRWKRSVWGCYQLATGVSPCLPPSPGHAPATGHHPAPSYSGHKVQWQGRHGKGSILSSPFMSIPRVPRGSFIQKLPSAFCVLAPGWAVPSSKQQQSHRPRGKPHSTNPSPDTVGVVPCSHWDGTAWAAASSLWTLALLSLGLSYRRL